MKHLNHKINVYGLEIAKRTLVEHGYLITQFDKKAFIVERAGVKYLVSANTKTADTRHDLKVTGKNQTHLNAVREKAVEHGCSDVLMVFIDASWKAVYGGTLKQLSKPRTFCKVKFPLEVLTTNERIVYFSAVHMETFGHMEAEEHATLVDMISRNKQAKNQTTIFD